LKTLVTLAAALVPVSFALADSRTHCADMGAVYELSGQDKTPVTIEVWRSGNLAAWVYPQAQQTEVWDRVAPHREKLTRYYDEHRRAIEYQAGEAVRSPRLAAFDEAWDDGCAVVETLVLRDARGTTRWQLKSTVDDPARVRAVFEQRESYPSTDFIDVGDNETDPFLRNLPQHGHH